MAQNAKKDDNGYPTITGVSSVDGVTPVRVLADPVTGYPLCEIHLANYSATPKSPVSDDNAVRVLTAVTNDASATPKAVITDPNNPGFVLGDFLQV